MKWFKEIISLNWSLDEFAAEIVIRQCEFSTAAEDDITMDLLLWASMWFGWFQFEIVVSYENWLKEFL